MRILDALFVGREDGSGELVAVSMSADGSAGMVGRLISFRLDGRERKGTTERALAGRAGVVVRSLAATLEPAAAIVVVLVEHAWALVLTDAITRIGGTEMVSKFVEAGAIDEVWGQLAPSVQGESGAVAP